jgi:cytochrome b6
LAESPFSGNRVYDWFDQRLGLSPILAVALKKRVPEHKHSFWYYWGGITLFFFIVMCLTGVLLLVYYRPGDEAYASVRRITHEIRFGWLIRSVHSWSANLMVAAAFVHMFSAFFMRAYRAPREFLWWSGFGLLSLAMLFGFSGYLLPMDDLAYFATKVGLGIPAVAPVVGPWIADLVRGGPEINADTISRFFALHVVILPALFIPMLMLHLGLVQSHGMSIPESEQEKPEAQRKSVPFFPNFVMKDLAVWLIALNVLALLAFVFPWPLGPAAVFPLVPPAEAVTVPRSQVRSGLTLSMRYVPASANCTSTIALSEGERMRESTNASCSSLPASPPTSFIFAFPKRTLKVRVFAAFVR